MGIEQVTILVEVEKEEIGKVNSEYVDAGEVPISNIQTSINSNINFSCTLKSGVIITTLFKSSLYYKLSHSEIKIFDYNYP